MIILATHNPLEYLLWILALTLFLLALQGARWMALGVIKRLIWLRAKRPERIEPEMCYRLRDGTTVRVRYVERGTVYILKNPWAIASVYDSCNPEDLREL